MIRLLCRVMVMAMMMSPHHDVVRVMRRCRPNGTINECVRNRWSRGLITPKGWCEGSHAGDAHATIQVVFYAMKVGPAARLRVHYTVRACTW